MSAAGRQRRFSSKQANQDQPRFRKSKEGNAVTVSIRQMTAVGSYIMRQRLKGRKRYPLVLMLEPLFRCNLECVGCGKIQYPEHILKKRVSAEQALAAAAECGAPV